MLLDTTDMLSVAMSGLSQVTYEVPEVGNFTDVKKVVRRIFGDK
jgi:hypothetical protein